MEQYIESVTQQITNILERAKDCIIAVKKAKGYTNREVAHISNLSEDTIKNFLSGKTLKNTGFIVVISLATSLGIDLNEMIGYTPPQKAETGIVTTANENYVAEIVNIFERRIEDIKNMYDRMLAEKETMWQARYDDLKEMVS